MRYQEGCNNLCHVFAKKSFFTYVIVTAFMGGQFRNFVHILPLELGSLQIIIKAEEQ